MRIIATALLVAMAALFAVATFFVDSHPAMAFLKAFAEAAMVGALADWFAVSALFRHPLGLPIPHTAIIANNKDRIARSLGGFLEKNFLTPEVLTAKLGSVDMAGKLAEWLREDGRTDQIAATAARSIPSVIQSLDDDTVRAFLDKNISERIRAIEVAPLLGTVLAGLTKENRHQALLDEALKIAARVLEDNKDAIRERIAKESPWYVPQFVDTKLYEKVVSSLENTLESVNADPGHELRRRFHTAVLTFIDDLRYSPDYKERVQALKEELVNHPLLRTYVAGLWDDVRRYVEGDIAKGDDSSLLASMKSVVERLVNTLETDEDLRRSLNSWVIERIAAVAQERRSVITRLITDTVAAWDGATLSQRIELYVGRDLQFIRINGTLVGGLVGLLIYSVSLLIQSAH